MNNCPAKDKRHALPWAARLFGASMLTIGMSSHSMAAETAAEPIDQIDEVDVTTRKQSALDAEAISLSDTPDAEPSVGGKTSIVIGLAARVAPVYDGSKTTKTSPFPYVDIHGLFHDRVFISDIRGIAFNVVDLGAFRAGMSLNYVGGRTSKDAPRLQGLPDIGGGAAPGGVLTLSVETLPFQFQNKTEIFFPPRAAGAVWGARPGGPPPPPRVS